MKTPFTREQVSDLIEYMPDTGLFRRKKHIWKGRTIIRGYVDHTGYLRVCAANHSVMAHRLAWLMHYGEWPDGEIDHINGDRQDNRIANLRVCSHVQNNHNQPMRRNNTSGVKGVHWNKRAGKWHAQVCMARKIHHVGLFDDLEQAAEAVMAKRTELHGEFAHHG